MRQAVYSLLSDDQTLRELGVQKVYASNAVDTPQENNFIVIRWELTVPAFALVGTQDVSIWSHLREPDYVHMEMILERVKYLMTTTTHREGRGGIFSQARWTGDSPDVRDDGWRTFTKSTDFSCNKGQ